MADQRPPDHDRPGRDKPLSRDLPPLTFGVLVPIVEDEPDD